MITKKEIHCHRIVMKIEDATKVESEDHMENNFEEGLS
jgi:hypothetical protein